MADGLEQFVCASRWGGRGTLHVYIPAFPPRSRPLQADQALAAAWSTLGARTTGVDSPRTARLATMGQVRTTRRCKAGVVRAKAAACMASAHLQERLAERRRGSTPGAAVSALPRPEAGNGGKATTARQHRWVRACKSRQSQSAMRRRPTCSWRASGAARERPVTCAAPGVVRAPPAVFSAPAPSASASPPPCLPRRHAAHVSQAPETPGARCDRSLGGGRGVGPA